MAQPTSELGARVPRKAKAILDRLVASRTITQAGMEWLVAATDPFHDDRVRMPGYPDLSTVNSLVQTYTTTVAVTAPAGQTNPYDVQFHFMPFSAPTPQVASSSPTPMNTSLMYVDGTLNGGTSGLIPLYSGWNIIVNGAPALFDWYNTSASSTLYSQSGLAIPQKFCSGHFRLIGAGIEVVNTTAELYKGGSTTVYRAPSGVESGVLKNMVSSPIPGVNWYLSVPTDFISLPPSTQGEAATYTDSRTWAAEEGCYIVNTQSDMENPYVTLRPGDVTAKKSYDTGTVTSDQGGSAIRPMWTTMIVAAGGNPPFGRASNGLSQAHALPFEMCGAFFAGLNANSTLQATVRYYFERIPATTEPDLLSLAQLPPAFDGVALEIYSRCLAEMPVGVPVSENPLGEWFTSVLDTISSVAPKIGNFVTSVGNAISSVGQKPTIAPVQSNATPRKNQQKQQVTKSKKKRDRKKQKAANRKP